MSENTNTENPISSGLTRPRRMRYSIAEGPDITSPPIKILVDTPSQPFFVHESLLRTNSHFFSAALKTEWKETSPDDSYTVVTLPETTAESFAIWVKWLYTGRIFITKPTDITRSNSNSSSVSSTSSGSNSDTSNPSSSSSSASFEWIRWSHIYALADFLQSPSFSDAAIDCLIEACLDREKYPLQLPGYIYPYSPRGSKHRLLAVDVFVKVSNRERWGREVEHPPEFLRDVLGVVGREVEGGIRGVGLRELFVEDDGEVGCRYHDHGGGACYREMDEFCF